MSHCLRLSSPTILGMSWWSFGNTLTANELVRVAVRDMYVNSHIWLSLYWPFFQGRLWEQLLLAGANQHLRKPQSFVNITMMWICRVLQSCRSFTNWCSSNQQINMVWDLCLTYKTGRECHSREVRNKMRHFTVRYASIWLSLASDRWYCCSTPRFVKRNASISVLMQVILLDHALVSCHLINFRHSLMFSKGGRRSGIASRW